MNELIKNLFRLPKKNIGSFVRVSTVSKMWLYNASLYSAENIFGKISLHILENLISGGPWLEQI